MDGTGRRRRGQDPPLRLIHRFGKLPLNVQVGGYHNVVRPNRAPEWNVRLQVQFLFPR